jgi:hypothetical protein
MAKRVLLLMFILIVIFGVSNAQLVITSDQWPYGVDCIGNKWEWYRGQNGTWGGYDPNPTDSTWDFTSGPQSSTASSEIRPKSESQGSPPAQATYAEKQILGADISWGWESKTSSAMYLYGFYASATNIYYDPPYRRPYYFNMLVGTSWTDIYSWDYSGITVYDTVFSEIINQGYVITPEGGPYPCLVMRYYSSSYAEFMTVPVIDEDYIIYEWIAPDVGSCATVQSQSKETNPFFTAYKDYFRMYYKIINESTPPVFSNTTIMGNTYNPGPHTIQSTITDGSGIYTDSLYYRIGNSGGYTPVLHDSVNVNTYYFTIPAAGPTYPDTVFYWLAATDNAPSHNRATEPPSAPNDSVFSYIVKDPSGDMTPPEFFNTTVWPDTSFTGPYPVSSTIIDSFGVGEAYLYYRQGGSGSYSLAVADSVIGDTFYFAIPYTVSPPAFIEYYLEAVDASPNYNVGYDPPGAPTTVFSFNVQDYEGPIIENTRVWPDTGYAGPFEVWSDIYDNSGVLSAYLFYKIQTNPWDSTTADSLQNDTTYFFTIPSITPPKVIRYYIKAYDNSANNNVSTDPPGAPGVVYQFIANPPGVDEESKEPIPRSVYLKISPNPMTRRCVLHFGIPREESVSLSIYNILGARVKTIVENSPFEGGHYFYNWQGMDERGMRVSSGVYFARLVCGSEVSLKPIVLSK